MTTHNTSTIHRNAPVALGSPFALLVNAVTGWADNAKNRREYNLLLEKTDFQLDDVGIDRAWLRTESRKRFWQT